MLERDEVDALYNLPLMRCEAAVADVRQRLLAQRTMRQADAPLPRRAPLCFAMPLLIFDARLRMTHGHEHTVRWQSASPADARRAASAFDICLLRSIMAVPLIFDAATRHARHFDVAHCRQRAHVYARVFALPDDLRQTLVPRHYMPDAGAKILCAF